jgi:hypothetical protein
LVTARPAAGQPGTVAELAALPDLIRGYEQVKLDSLARYRDQLASPQAELASVQPPPAAIEAAVTA